MRRMLPLFLSLALAVTVTGCTRTASQTQIPAGAPAAAQSADAGTSSPAATATPAPSQTPAPETSAPESGAAESTAPAAKVLPFDQEMNFTFSSGAGGWSTELYLNPDGSFTGAFHDSEMGEMAEEYPGGSFYFCTFSGRFDPVEPVNDGTWALTLAELTLENEPGQESIEAMDGEKVRFVSAEPYGIEGGKNFLLYSPLTPTAELDEEFLSWWPDRFLPHPPATLGTWGLLNKDTGNGFFSGEVVSDK